VRRDEQGGKKEHVWKLAASPQMKGNGQPPRVLDQIIEMMFPFAALGGFDFYARLLSIQSIDDAKYKRSDDSEADTAKCECNGSAASNDETHNRDLIWRDSRFAKKRDDCRFDWSVNVSGQVECSILRGIENDALCDTLALLRRRCQTKWPHAPTHADDVIVFLCRVDGIDPGVVADPCEFVQERRCG